MTTSSFHVFLAITYTCKGVTVWLIVEAASFVTTTGFTTVGPEVIMVGLTTVAFVTSNTWLTLTLPFGIALLVT